MTRLNKIKSLFALLLLTFSISYSFGESIVDEEYGFSLDIPEGYNLTDATPDSKTIQFNHDSLPLTFIMKIYDEDDVLQTSEEALSLTLDKLKATYEAESFMWNKDKSAISYFEMKLDKKYTGWSVSAPLKNNSFLVLLCYCPVEDMEDCNSFIFSTLNSLCTDEYYYNNPGIVVTAAFPKTGSESITTKIAGKEVTYLLDKSDLEGAQFVVDCEFNVLKQYGNHKLKIDAWKRYYRMIYRDNYGRISDFSKNAYEVLYPLAENELPENPQIKYAQYLLSWVQRFNYKRSASAKESDFTSLPAILEGEGNDCDSRSLLICAALEYAGIDTLLLVSPEYSHALVAADIEAQGQTFHNKEDNKDYIMGETTAKVTWGMIAKDQADRNKWFAVSLP